MKNPQIELARKFIGSLKKHWLRTNPDAQKIAKYFKEKYRELPRPDHMAIRSISGIGFGIDEANSLFSALGYKFGGYWPIPKLNIMACHFEPPAPDLEKIFFSEVHFENHDTEKLLNLIMPKSSKDWLRTDIYDVCSLIYSCHRDKTQRPLQIDVLFDFLMRAMWELELTRKKFAAISEKCSQEIIHVMAFGFVPNHFTFLMQDPNHKYPGYTTMENLSKEMESLGIKMQEQVEGAENSILCQTSTKAYPGKFKTYKKKNGNEYHEEDIKIEWPRSYIEFIKRGADPASPTGRYEGFLPNQAQALFKMTAKT